VVLKKLGAPSATIPFCLMKILDSMEMKKKAKLDDKVPEVNARWWHCTNRGM